MPCFSITAVHTLPESCLVFSINFSSSACTPMYNYGRTWNSSETNQVLPDTVQYALGAGGREFDSPHPDQPPPQAGVLRLCNTSSLSREILL
jgi:hypothetical protein